MVLEDWSPRYRRHWVPPWWGLSSWLADSRLPTAGCRGLGSAPQSETLPSSSSYRDANPAGALSPPHLSPAPFQRPHLHTQPHWGIRASVVTRVDGAGRAPTLSPQQSAPGGVCWFQAHSWAAYFLPTSQGTTACASQRETWWRRERPRGLLRRQETCDHMSARLHLALHACLSARVTSLTEPSPKTQIEAVLSTRIWWMREWAREWVNGKKPFKAMSMFMDPLLCVCPSQWLWKDPTGSITAFLRSNARPRLREDWQHWVEFTLTQSPPLSQVKARIRTPNKFLSVLELPSPPK